MIHITLISHFHHTMRCRILSANIWQLVNRSCNNRFTANPATTFLGQTVHSRHFPTHKQPVGRAMTTQARASQKVAVVQMTSIGDQQTNFNACKRLAEEAKAQGCSMIFYPECCTFIGSSSAETVQAAQPLDGPLMSQFRDLAIKTGLWMSLGGFQETGPDPQHIYNTQVVLDERGHIQAIYRKVHLFNVDVPNGPVLMESNTTVAGDQVVTVDTPVGRIGLTICYDLRFPELYQHLAWDKGCTVVTVPSAFTVVTGEAHWDILLRARAIECQSYVIAAAQAGVHNHKRQSYGHALIADPWGVIVAKLPDPLATGIAVAEIDHEKLQRIRQKMPIAEHRAAGRQALGWS